MPKVLIVDDSPAQLYSLRRMVEMAGHQAVVAESGERALEVAAAEHPAVILMDIVMPGMSGYQATRNLGRADSTRHIPVIFVSARNGEADRQGKTGSHQGLAGAPTDSSPCFRPTAVLQTVLCFDSAGHRVSPNGVDRRPRTWHGTGSSPLCRILEETIPDAPSYRKVALGGRVFT